MIAYTHMHRESERERQLVTNKTDQFPSLTECSKSKEFGRDRTRETIAIQLQGFCGKRQAISTGVRLADP